MSKKITKCKEKPTTLIKPKSDWSLHSKPVFYGGSKPEKVYDTTDKTEIVSFDTLDVVSLREIREKVPEGFDDDHVVIELENNYDADKVVVSVLKKVREENENYEAELIEYNRKKKEFNLEVEQWKCWKAQEEDRLLNERLRSARELLKKHGELK